MSASLPGDADHVGEDAVRSTIVQRWRYWFDNTMSRGTPALIGLLGLASALLIAAVAGLALLFTPGEVGGTPQALWRSLMRTIDPGTMGSDQGTAPFLALMLLVSIGGIFSVSALVGILSSGLDTRLAQLRKGKSHVVEHGHTVILGWSEQLFTIIAELAEASEGNHGCVTILADRDKVEMEDEIRQRLPRNPVRIVCRTGNPARPLDLDIVRPDHAAVIIVPTPATSNPDIHVVKTLLALQHREWPAGRPPVVAAIARASNLPAASLAGPDVTFVDAEDITARLIVQSRRHPGLSAVCTDLLSFSGEEIHTHADPALAGRTFGELLTAYATATVFGIRHRDGRVTVNPPTDTVLGDGDHLIVLAATRTSIRAALAPVAVAETAISDRRRDTDPADATLVLGWNNHGSTIITLLDEYLPHGSQLTVAAAAVPAAIRLPTVVHLSVRTAAADPTDRGDLEGLDPGAYQHVVVLADDGTDAEAADARTLVTLLHLRDLKARQAHPYAIVGEITDVANHGLAQVTRADDFVVSTKMISLLLAQLSRNHHLAPIFAELFDPRGSDIYLKPAGDYLIPGATANFATVVEAARRRGETAIGYRRDADIRRPPSYGVVLNPDKAQTLVLEQADRIIVLADH